MLVEISQVDHLRSALRTFLLQACAFKGVVLPYPFRLELSEGLDWTQKSIRFLVVESSKIILVLHLKKVHSNQGIALADSGLLFCHPRFRLRIFSLIDDYTSVFFLRNPPIMIIHIPYILDIFSWIIVVVCCLKIICVFIFQTDHAFLWKGWSLVWSLVLYLWLKCWLFQEPFRRIQGNFIIFLFQLFIVIFRYLLRYQKIKRKISSTPVRWYHRSICVWGLNGQKSCLRDFPEAFWRGDRWLHRFWIVFSRNSINNNTNIWISDRQKNSLF